MSFAAFQQQKQVVQLLQRSLDRGRLAHAYLFSGSSLEELEGVARTFAKTLNCLQPPLVGNAKLPLDCCDQCLSCRKVQDENHADVHWVRPESKSRVITIDQMRSLMHVVHLKTTEALYKVAVIVAGDRLNVQAANAFLKTLEEPPQRSILVLLTTEPERMLETIVSRCLRLNFSGDSSIRESSAEVGWLSVFSQMAASAQMNLLNRYKLLGVVLARLTELKDAVEKTVSARSPLERFDDIEPRLRDKWEDELSAAIEAEYRYRRGNMLIALQWWFRDVWLTSLLLSKQLLRFPSLEPATSAVADRISSADALANIETVEQSLSLLATNVQEALALEVSFLKLKL